MEPFKNDIRGKGLSLKQPKLLFDDKCAYKQTALVGCIWGGQVSVFHSEAYVDLFTVMDQVGGWFSRSGSDQTFLALFVALHLYESEVEILDYVNIARTQPA